MTTRDRAQAAQDIRINCLGSQRVLEDGEIFKLGHNRGETPFALKKA
jgi:hypothetical protein